MPSPGERHGVSSGHFHMLGVLKLGEQDRQHWRCALPNPPRTSFNVLHLMRYVPPMCGWMDGPDGLSLWTSNQFRTHGILFQRYCSSGRRCARSHIAGSHFHRNLPHQPSSKTRNDPRSCAWHRVSQSSTPAIPWYPPGLEYSRETL